jgi:putative transcriptional regulator
MSAERPNHIRKLRRAADLTQEELARLASIHPQHLGDLERGKYSPTLATAQAIASALKVTVDDLFLAVESGTAPDNQSVMNGGPDGPAARTEPSEPLVASTPGDGTSRDGGVAK